MLQCHWVSGYDWHESQFKLFQLLLPHKWYGTVHAVTHPSSVVSPWTKIINSFSFLTSVSTTKTNIVLNMANSLKRLRQGLLCSDQLHPQVSIFCLIPFWINFMHDYILNISFQCETPSRNQLPYFFGQFNMATQGIMSVTSIAQKCLTCMCTEKKDIQTSCWYLDL